MKFLHAADLHIDSQLRGLDSMGHAPAERIRAATREAVTLMIDLAIREQVSFVIVAGDVFDGPWPDATTGAWTASEFRRLHNASIPVFLLRGNHDAHSQVASATPWAPSVHEFRADQPETVLMDSLPVALHGQGFARRDAPQDLAANYPPAVEGRFNIGVLHTSLAGHPEHDRYAPTTEAVLCSKRYDYWALGHIHKRNIIRPSDPAIVFSGNTQGRHIQEAGERGCYVVQVDSGRVAELAFHPTDVVRWSQLVLDAEPDDEPDALREKIEQALVRLSDEAEGRLAAVRLTLQGRCPAHRRWRDPSEREQWIQEIRHLDVCRSDVWIEKLQIRTQPIIDRDKLRQGEHVLGDLLRLIDSLRDDDAALAELAAALSPLTDKAAAALKQADVDWDSPQQLRAWLDQAEANLVSQMWEEAEA